MYCMNNKSRIAYIAVRLLLVVAKQWRICKGFEPIKCSHFTSDDFFSSAHNAVHSLDPFPLRPAFQILGYALGFHHLTNDVPIAFLRLFVQIGKVGVQSARQNQVVQQKGVRFLQICLVQPSPFPDGAVIVPRKFNGRDVVVPSKNIIKAVGFVMDF